MAKPKPPISIAPIWTRPSPGMRQPRLTRDQIAQAALAIADAEGFDAVSMRRVASALGAGTMTLYYYVKTKDDLLTLMDDALMAEVVIPADKLPRGWRAGLIALARATRDVYINHPWALQALQGARMGPNGIRHIEQSLVVVDDMPADVPMRLQILSIVDDFVFGYVLRTAEIRRHPADARVIGLISAFFEEQIAGGDYPLLKNMFGEHDVAGVLTQTMGWMTSDTRFDLGLEALLDGLEHQLRAAPRSPVEAAPRSQPGPARAETAPRGKPGDRMRARSRNEPRVRPVTASRPVRARPAGRSRGRPRRVVLSSVLRRVHGARRSGIVRG